MVATSITTAERAAGQASGMEGGAGERHDDGATATQSLRSFVAVCRSALGPVLDTGAGLFMEREKQKKRAKQFPVFFARRKKSKKKERRAKLRQECSKAMPCTTTCVSLKTVLALGRKNTEHLAARGMT